jgi:predicted RNA-binding protein (virulence factor B family)
MTRHYLEVIKEGISICLDTDVHYHHQFKIGDIIYINMYSDKGPKLVFGTVEYDAVFTLDWTKTSSARLDIGSCITNGYLKDITIQMLRDKKLDLLL